MARTLQGCRCRERGQVSVRRGEHKGHIQVTGPVVHGAFSAAISVATEPYSPSPSGKPSVSRWASPKHEEMALQTHSSPVRPSVRAGGLVPGWSSAAAPSMQRWAEGMPPPASSGPWWDSPMRTRVVLKCNSINYQVTLKHV